MWIFRLLLLSLLALGCGASPRVPVSTVASTDQPNIVWIVAEDLSPLLPAFGDTTVATPHLDRLAARGIRFPNTFSVSGVCAPSRAALATGMYPTSVGAHHMRTQYNAAALAELGLQPYGALLPPAVKMMSTVLREHGYFCTNNNKNDYQFEAPKVAWDENHARAHYRHRSDPAQPFFSVFNLEITHESQVWATQGAKLRFDADGFERPDGPPVRQGRLPEAERPPIDTTLAVPVPPYLVDGPRTRRDLRQVYANLVRLDHQVGVLLDQLAADGLLDETIIFWYTDHGGPLPRQKRLLYDSGLRVPLIVAFPDGRGAGRVDSSLISFVDFAPTVFSLAHIPVPDYVQGRAVLGPQRAAPRDYVFAAADRFDGHYDRIRAARDRRYKYLRNYYPERPYYLPVKYREQMGAMQELLAGRDAGTLTPAQAQWFRSTKPAEELFDTYADPHELHDLAADPAHAATLARLRAACTDWLIRTGDLGEMDERTMVRNWWQGDTMPVTAAPSFRPEPAGFRLASATPGARIAYRYRHADADRPGWRVYTGPFRAPARADTLEVVAQRIGYRESPVRRFPVSPTSPD